VTAAYTYQDGKVIKAEGADSNQIGNQLARTPEHSLSVWGNYTINSKWSAGLGAQYISERFNSTNESTREQADSYITFDSMVAYKVSKQATVRFNVSNLADEEYADQLGGGHFIPGEGRHFLLNADYSF
jgi:catecholate siderophore receptor